MDAVINNFYLLKHSGEPIFVTENFFDNQIDIKNDDVFKTSLSRLGQNASEETKVIDYKDILHFVKNVGDYILVIGFRLNAGVKSYFSITTRNIMDKLNIERKIPDQFSPLAVFQEKSGQIIDILLNRINNEIKSKMNMSVYSKLTRAYITN